MRPRLLDLFCGEYGSSYGYAEAGFDVTAVDIVKYSDPPHPNITFVRADAMTFPLDGFAVRAGSPPCTGHSTIGEVTGLRGNHGTEWMLQATIDRFRAVGGPWVVENVEGSGLTDALTLCGSEFGLTDGGYLLRRHRRFASNVFLWGAGGCSCHGRKIIGVYGDLSENDRKCSSRARVDGRPYGDMRAGIGRAKRIMGMPWAGPVGVKLAIPPAYTRFIGGQLMDYLTSADTQNPQV